MKDIGDRMKANYENRARFYLTRRTPVIIRCDGRAFHTFTRQFDKPFDLRLQDAMDAAMVALLTEAQGAKMGYRQSDEISILLTDWDTLQTDAWFNYNLTKLCSISASIVTAAFNEEIGSVFRPNAQFDARAFNIPPEEVVNYFVWRAKDWYRNSVTMFANSFFSHKQMFGKSIADLHEMLHNSHGANWTLDLTPVQRNGTFYVKLPNGLWKPHYDVGPHYQDINVLHEECMGQ